MPVTTPSIAVIGLGPRSVSVLERLVSHLEVVQEPPEELTLYLIDDAQHGGGRIWDINQTHALVMNTFAHGMTLFSEPGSTVKEPVTQGPTIYEWIRLVIGDTEGITQEKVDYFNSYPLREEFRPVTQDFSREELEAFRPESYLPRALYGFYIQWVYSSVLSRLPEWVMPVPYYARAVSIREKGSVDLITLNTGETLEASGTLFVSGWQRQGFTRQEEWVAARLRQNPGLAWIRADNPIDQDVASLKPGENVLVRGLGMGFFDSLILTTVERGGRFVEDPQARGGLRYEASGQEPRYFASSRRGYPFMPQADDRGLPAPAPLTRLKRVIAELKDRTAEGSIDYDAEVWPAVAKDAYDQYVTTLARVRPEALRSPLPEIIAAIDAAEVRAKNRFGGVEELDAVVDKHTLEPFSLRTYLDLIPDTFPSIKALNAWVGEQIAADIAESAQGQDGSPTRAALWSLGFARKPTQLLGAEGRYTPESRTNMFDHAVAAGQLACSGPPLFRSRQLLALIDAGIVTLIGASPVLTVDDATGEWVMRSEQSASESARGTTVLDAWVHKPDIRRIPADSLMAQLVATGRIRPFAQDAADGTPLLTGSPEIDPATRLVVGREGDLDPRLHIIGIAAHSQYPDTTLAPPLPGTDSMFIQEADLGAVSVLNVVLNTSV
ncbi:putative oxidoreductase [Corynebacterium renale]|uniref:FAD/NAD(P)-binding protein n=1 Tax=Corynebacterium renale TaxID=1724 RepID=UPI000DA3CE33|nr:FAD/NAD(P)-binding protein [Corynebacterium renale]SQG63683.1 putative oxidoreductase [Corynebacterium renale]STD01570.1 putative oxidoreductase [Corynebacterium renale]